jgi:hypothetical protein
MNDRPPARILRRCIAVCVVVAVSAAVPVAFGDDLPIEVGPAAPAMPATRGSAVQLTETLPPPPPTTAAPFPAKLRADQLEVPADSGTGRRVVYSMGIQRVWMIEDDGSIYNTHRVSGRLDSPGYGTYKVWSRSTFTCSIVHPDVCMRYMVRFAKKSNGNNIGFHSIPYRDGKPLQEDDQLGTPLSGGCVRQVLEDAILMWDWAQLGTVVVVIP